MRRFPWWILGALVALFLGLGLGLAYSWIISPLRLVDSVPAALRADFKDQIRSVIAASYASTGNLPRAQARLAYLGDSDPVGTLNAQAQRDISNSQFKQAEQLAALAFALENGTNLPMQAPPTYEDLEPVTVEPTVSPFPSPADRTFITTETQPPPQTQASQLEPVWTVTPRPTRTPVPTPGVPFDLIAQDVVCDSNLPDGLLQVFVFSSNRRQMAGIKVVITWASGGEEFFTGLKPEIGNGYADFLMTPDTSYSVQLGPGSDIASDITAPLCQAQNGESFLGGYKLTFQQP